MVQNLAWITRSSIDIVKVAWAKNLWLWMKSNCRFADKIINNMIKTHCNEQNDACHSVIPVQKHGMKLAECLKMNDRKIKGGCQLRPECRHNVLNSRMKSLFVVICPVRERTETETSVVRLHGEQCRNERNHGSFRGTLSWRLGEIYDHSHCDAMTDTRKAFQHLHGRTAGSPRRERVTPRRFDPNFISCLRHMIMPSMKPT